MKEYELRLNEDKIPILYACRDFGGANLESAYLVEKFMNEKYCLKDMAEEYTYIISLDCQLCGIAIFQISHGTAEESALNPKEVMTRLLLSNASRFMIIHNHPSGKNHPSKADIQVAEKMKQIGELLNIELVDSLIIGNTVFSFREENYL